MSGDDARPRSRLATIGPRGAIALVLLGALAACGGKKAAGGSACDARADRLAARLAARSAGSSSGVAPAPAGLAALEANSDRPFDRRGPTLVVGRDGALSMDELHLPSIDPALRDQLRLEDRVATEPRALYVWIDRDTPAATLAAILAVVPPALTLRLLALAPGAGAGPAEAALEAKPSVRRFIDDIAARPPAERAVEIAAKLEDAIGGCVPLREAFRNLASVESGRDRLMVEVVPRALRDCRCELADADLFEYAMLSLHTAYDRPLGWLPPPLIAPGERRTVGELTH